MIELCTGYLIDTILITLNRRRNVQPVFVRENLDKLTDEEKSTWLDFAPSFFYEHERLAHNNFSPYKQIIQCMITSIYDENLTSEQQSKISSRKQTINKVNNGIDEVLEETDPCVISALMWTWLRLLKVTENVREVCLVKYLFDFSILFLSKKTIDYLQRKMLNNLWRFSRN